jgi:phosphoenolpyruvate carboxykinase (GTP)
MVLDFVEEMKAMVNPDKVLWIDGSNEQLEELRAQACTTGEIIKLDE